MSTITSKFSLLALFIFSFILMSSECSSQKVNRDTKGVIYFEQLTQRNAAEIYRKTQNECEKKPTETCSRKISEAKSNLLTTNSTLEAIGIKPLPRPGGILPPPPPPNPCMPSGNCHELRSVLDARIIFPREMEFEKIRYVDTRTGKTIAEGRLSPSKDVKNYNVATFKATNMDFKGQLSLVIEGIKGVKGEALNMPIANVGMKP